MLAELAIDPESMTKDGRQESPPAADPIAEAIAAWAEAAGDGPHRMVDIVQQALGVTPVSDRYAGLIILAASALVCGGFVSSRDIWHKFARYLTFPRVIVWR